MKNPQEDVEFMLDVFGYEKREYGWVKDNPKGTSQAVTVWYEDTDIPVTVQMFGWFTRNTDEIDYKIYDTGHIALDDSKQLQVLLTVFDQYKFIDG
jgi:hypothetical protein